jgi:phosphoserine phosphatase
MERVIVTLTGKDSPGITYRVAEIVSQAGADVVDLRQTVVRRRLTLVLELELGRPGSSDGLFLGIVSEAKRFGLAVDFDTAPGPRLKFAGTDATTELGVELDQSSESVPLNYVLTLLSADGIPPRFLEEIADVLAVHYFSVDKVARLSSGSMRCLELVVSTTRTVTSADLTLLRKVLYGFGKTSSIDVALQAESVLRRSKRLVVMDMDSTLIQQEVIDELARYAGVYDQVQEITHRAMNGELDFNQSLEMRVKLLKGTPESNFDKVIENLAYTDGAHYLCRSLKKLGYRLAVISGGFRTVTQHVRKELGLDYDYANQLEVRDGILTGRTKGPIVNAQRKADLLVTIAQKEGVTLEQCVAIGDGSNDLPMLGAAGLGIAFNAKPAVQEAATFRVNQRNLDSILYLLGFSEEDQRDLSGEP